MLVKALMLLTVALVGCTSNLGEPAASPVIPVATSEATLPSTPLGQVTVTPQSAPESEDMIIFRRTGGLAGLDESWTLFRDGRMVSETDAAVQLDSDLLSQIWDLIDSDRFFALEESYLPQNPCCDRFKYEVTVQASGQTQGVVSVDDTPIPADLEQVLDLLQQGTALFATSSNEQEGADKLEAASVTEETHSDQPLTPAPSDAVREASTEESIIYHRTGGFAGVDETWIFYRNGRIESLDGTIWQLDSKASITLWSLVDDGSFFNLDGTYMPKQTCCDLFQHEISVQTVSRKHVVTTMDGGTIPDVLRTFLELLGDAIAAPAVE